MASKLDQSLDAIIGDRGSSRRGRGARRVRGGRAAPVGGIKKASTAVTRTAAKVAGKVANKVANKGEAGAPTTAATKVIVSNLPTDVNEAQIKDYFQQVAGPVKRVWLTYGANGASRGIATILFNTAAAGAKAMEQKGTKVDNRTLRVEAVVGTEASTAPAKTLRERATAPNAQPKKATAAPAANDKATRGKAGTRGRGRVARGRNAGRPKKKTAEELDAEMTDYFGANGEPVAAPAPAAAAAAPAGGDDLGMDEIS